MSFAWDKAPPTKATRVVQAIEAVLMEEAKARNLADTDLKTLRPDSLPEKRREELVEEIKKILNGPGG